MGDEELSVCVRLASFGEADALKQVLDEEQVPYRERPYLDTAFDGIGLAMHQQSGWGEVWVRVEDEARVGEALTEIRAAAKSAPEPEADAAAEPEAPMPKHETAEARRLNFRGLWLLIGVLVLVVVGVLVATMLGGDRCDAIADPLKREQCERDRANVQQPRDWR